MRFGGFGYEQQFGFGLSPTPAASAAPAYAAWPALVGAEMMVNGDCSSGTGWSLGTGFAIAAGKMGATAVTPGFSVSNDGAPFTAIIDNATYRCVFTIDSVVGGSVQLGLGNALGTVRSTAATFSQDLVADDPVGSEIGWALFSVTSATMQLDSFSVKSIGLLGVEGDWSGLGGNWAWGGTNTQSLSGVGISQSDIVSLTGSALTSFTAAVSFNTACLVSVYVEAPSFEAENVSVRVHQGSWVALNITTSGWSTPVAVTSGAVAGFEIRGNAGGTAEAIIQAVDIDLA